MRPRHPSLGAAVRCLISREKGVEQRDSATLLVHPDDGEGLQEAISVLGAMAVRPLAPPSSSRNEASVDTRGMAVA
jgi:hypothetical protein